MLFPPGILNITDNNSADNTYMLKRFLIYGILGLGMEIFWTGAGALLSGDLRLVGSPTYGCSSKWLCCLPEPKQDAIAGGNGLPGDLYCWLSYGHRVSQRAFALSVLDVYRGSTGRFCSAAL
jgi:hypothetical protein